MTVPDGARSVLAVAGGDINDGYRVTLADGREAFVKTRADPAPGEYAAEADGLRWLGAAGALPAPEVLEVNARYLALEWVQPGAGGVDADGAEELGRGLAALHAAGARCFGVDGGPRASARFGWIELPNDPAPDWPSFYAERRLRPLGRLAAERAALSDRALVAIERVCGRMAELCGPAEPPARLHGDLWSGNVLADERGRPWLIDPSAYGGHREVDLAMLALFGAPHLERTLSAYDEAAPLADGWRERSGLHQLLPLLIHALLFGGGYGASVERAASRWA